MFLLQQLQNDGQFLQNMFISKYLKSMGEMDKILSTIQ